MYERKTSTFLIQWRFDITTSFKESDSLIILSFLNGLIDYNCILTSWMYTINKKIKSRDKQQLWFLKPTDSWMFLHVVLWGWRRRLLFWTFSFRLPIRNASRYPFCTSDKSSFPVATDQCRICEIDAYREEFLRYLRPDLSKMIKLLVKRHSNWISK